MLEGLTLTLTLISSHNVLHELLCEPDKSVLKPFVKQWKGGNILSPCPANNKTFLLAVNW